MSKFFYSDYIVAERLGAWRLPPGNMPKGKFEECPYCRTRLATSYEIQFRYSRELEFELGFCLKCGWWDLIYREKAPYQENEEDLYLHSILLKLGSSEEAELANTILLNDLARDNFKLYDITPRKLEEVIASIYKNIFDCSVELTARTRDGGKDIVGIDSSNERFIVEVKRYKRERKIRVELVRQLVGVMCIDKVNRATLITTSSFTKDAIEARDQLNTHGQLNLELKDFNDLVGWLKLSYERYFDFSAIENKLQWLEGTFKFPREFIDPSGARVSIDPEALYTKR